jgi:hypothetical protein
MERNTQIKTIKKNHANRMVFLVVLLSYFVSFFTKSLVSS